MMIFAIIIGAAGLLAFMLGLGRVLKKSRQSVVIVPAPNNPPSKFVLTAKDISCIAGDDVMATRLDLARAYLETGKRKLAKQILESVAKQGSHTQQEEALYLLSTL
jgi:FimV-like protein